MSIILEVWLGASGGAAASGRAAVAPPVAPAIAGVPAAAPASRGSSVQDAAHQRPHHEQQHDEAEQRHHAELDAAHDVVLGELQEATASRPAPAIGVGRRFGEAQVDDLDLVAALLVEADRGAHQRGDAVELFLGARLVDGLALVVLGVDAVDQHGGRDALDAAAFGHLGLGRAGDLVVDDFLGFLLWSRCACACRRLAAGLLRAGQFVADA